MLKTELIAKLAYESDRLYSKEAGIEDKPAWEDLSKEVQKALMNGVEFLTKYPRSAPSQVHENWRKHLIDLKWTLAEDGKIDRENKRHPWLLPFNRVPQHIRVKTYMFHAIVTMAVVQIGTTGNVEIPKTEPEVVA